MLRSPSAFFLHQLLVEKELRFARKHILEDRPTGFFAWESPLKWWGNWIQSESDVLVVALNILIDR